MFNRILFPFLLMLLSLNAVAQDDPQKSERIQAVRVSFITDKIHLTPDQSAKFWPVYNQYVSELRAMRKRLKENIQKNNPNLTKEQARAQVDASIEYQQQIVNLKKNYKDRLLQVISPQQLNQLYAAEQEFKTILVKML